jgi:hypothetical protein
LKGAGREYDEGVKNGNNLGPGTYELDSTLAKSGVKIGTGIRSEFKGNSNPGP